MDPRAASSRAYLYRRPLPPLPLGRGKRGRVLSDEGENAEPPLPDGKKLHWVRWTRLRTALSQFRKSTEEGSTDEARSRETGQRMSLRRRTIEIDTKRAEPPLLERDLRRGAPAGGCDAARTEPARIVRRSSPTGRAQRCRPDELALLRTRRFQSHNPLGEHRRNMLRFIKSKKGIVAMLATLVVVAGSAVGAYAYFTAAGSGNGQF